MFFRTVEVSLRNQILRKRLTLGINILFACLMTRRCSSWKRGEKRLLLTLHVTILNSLPWQWVSRYMYTWATSGSPLYRHFTETVRALLAGVTPEYRECAASRSTWDAFAASETQAEFQIIVSRPISYN